MGHIKKIVGKVKLPEPGGWDPEKGQFNLPFAIELRECWHIHWADMRIEMTSEDFEPFAKAIHQAYQNWVTDGKPEILSEMKRYGEWPGEEGLDHFKERNMPKTKSRSTRFHYKKFPRTESGKLYFEPVFQVELQEAGWYHLHYKNFRLELGKDQLKNMVNAMKKIE